MSTSNKAKTAGKFIIVILSLAILFFLLLPFLDNSGAPSATATGEKSKKAIPQIFTSNPLSDLVNKVYALFARDQKEKQPAPTYTEEELLYAQADQSRFASENTGTGTTHLGTAFIDTNIDESYKDDASLIDESGEWVLIKQNTPDISQRGMHDVRSSDSAYDKLVRMERAAKYTAGPAQKIHQYPDSKWARLWKPIQNFFTGEESATPIAPAGAISAANEESFLRASGKSENPQAQYKRPRSFRRLGDLPRSLGVGSVLDIANPFNVDERGFNFDFLLHPENSLKDYDTGLREIANAYFDPKRAEEMNNKAPEAADLKQQMTEKMMNNLLAAAEGEPEDLITKTAGCTDGPSGFYSNNTECDIPSEISLSDFKKQEEDFQKTIQEDTLNAQKQQEHLRQLIISEAKSQNINTDNLNMDKLNMAIVLGRAESPLTSSRVVRFKEDAENQEEIDKQEELIHRQDKALSGFYENMFNKQDCQENNCYWVGANNPKDPSLQNTIVASGMNYNGDPLKLVDTFIKDYQQEELKKAKTEEEKQAINQIAEDLKNFPPYYVAYTSDQMRTLSQRNDSSQPENPLMLYVPTADNALELVQNQDWSYPGAVLHGNDVLVAEHAEDNFITKTPADRGMALFNLLQERKQEAHQILREQEAELLQQGVEERFKEHAENVQKEVQDNLGTGAATNTGTRRSTDFNVPKMNSDRLKGSAQTQSSDSGLKP